MLANVLTALLPGSGAFTEALKSQDLIVQSLVLTFGFVTATKYVVPIFLATWSYVLAYCTCHVEVVAYQDRRNILTWMANKGKNCRSLLAENRNDLAWSLHEEAKRGLVDGEDSRDWPLSHAPIFTPNSTNWFYHNKRWIQIERTHSLVGTYEQEMQLGITVFGLSPEPIKSLIREAAELYKLKQGRYTERYFPKSLKLRRDSREPWAAYPPRRRTLDSLVVPPSILRDLVDDAVHFDQPEQRAFYDERGLPYKRTYLLSGPPGTGKSSISLALAERLGRPLRSIPLTDGSLGDEDLRDLMKSTTTASVILLADLDQAVLRNDGHRDDDKKRGITQGGMMDLLDASTVGCEGNVFVVTVNDKEKLDKVLIRPGRIDKEIRFGYVCPSLAKRMFLWIYQSKTDGVPEDLQAQATAFEARFAWENITPAKLWTYLVTMREFGPEVALSKMQKLDEDVEAAET